MGFRICGKEKFRIDKISNWSGYLNWDCSDIDPGLYFIKVNHGSNTQTMKVLINH